MSHRDLPEGWTLASLGELARWSGGGTPSKDVASFWSNGTIPWVSPKDMKCDRVRGSEDHVTEEAVQGSAAKHIPVGSVLVVTRSGILEHTLPVAITDVGVTVNQDLKALTPAPGVEADYLAWAMRAHGSAILSSCKKDGTTVASIETDALRRFSIPVAPTLEQRRVVEVIESQVSRLEAAVGSLERAQVKLRAYRASVLKAAVEGRLVPTEASLARAEKRTYEPAENLLDRILAERRRRWEEEELSRLTAAGRAPKNDKWKEKYKEPAAPSSTGLPDLPDGWCWARAETFFWDAGYGTSEKCSQEPNGPPVLRIPNVVNGCISLEDLKYAGISVGLPSDGWVAPGDFLFIRTNGSKSLIGRGALVVDDYEREHYFASYLIRLRLVGLGSVPEWFAFAWHAPTVRAQLLKVAASSAGQHNVSLSSASDFLVPLPPAAELERILAEVARILSASEAAEVDVAKDTRRCARLRQAILKWAFEGKLIDQDPSDESAAKLLERIGERAAATPPKKTRARKAKATS